MNDKAQNIMQYVNSIIYPSYMVGGSVRDILMGREPNDYDFTTPLDPETIEKKIKMAGKKPYLTGKRFGTLGLKFEGQVIEITTFRTEKYEAGNRKPEVTFVTNLQDDLSRRDFTINAIAIPIQGHFVDPFNGMEDIQDKIIRAVGNPVKRFREDPLRLLRAIRFACQLDYTIEKRTFDAIKEKNYKILQISKERWMQELDKILLSDKVVKGLEYLAYTELLNYIIPELSIQVGYDQNSPYHDLYLWEHTLEAISRSPKDIDIRWALLLHDIGKPFVRKDKTDRSTYVKHDLLGADLVERIARHLRWSNDRRNKVRDLVLHHMDKDSILRPYDKGDRYETSE